MSKVLCRIDPEKLIEMGMDSDGFIPEDIREYITIHAVPENTMVFSEMEEMEKFLLNACYGDAKHDAQAILNRFGPPWNKAPEWADRIVINWACFCPGGEERFELIKTIMRPISTPSLEDKRKKSMELLKKAGEKSVDKIFEVLAREVLENEK